MSLADYSTPLVFVWLLIGVTFGVLIANRRGVKDWIIPTLYGLVAAIFGPLAGIAYWLSLTRRCPHCAQRIRREARVCRWCGREVNSSAK